MDDQLKLLNSNLGDLNAVLERIAGFFEGNTLDELNASLLGLHKFLDPQGDNVLGVLSDELRSAGGRSPNPKRTTRPRTKPSVRTAQTARRRQPAKKRAASRPPKK